MNQEAAQRLDRWRPHLASWGCYANDVVEVGMLIAQETAGCQNTTLGLRAETVLTVQELYGPQIQR